MSNLGEQAMEILDELHTERLSYESEYVPLADAANLLTAYEQTGMDPEAIDRMADAYGRGLTLREDAAERLEIIRGLSTARLRELAEADRDGRCVVFQPEAAVASMYYKEDELCIRVAAGVVSEEEYEQAALKGEQDATKV